MLHIPQWQQYLIITLKKINLSLPNTHYIIIIHYHIRAIIILTVMCAIRKVLGIRENKKEILVAATLTHDDDAGQLSKDRSIIIIN